MPLMFAGGVAIAIAVGLQYFLIFRSIAVVVAVTLAIAAGAWFVTRNSFGTFEISMRYNLGLLTAESKTLYVEIDG
jgi:hypothetical protein